MERGQLAKGLAGGIGGFANVAYGAACTCQALCCVQHCLARQVQSAERYRRPQGSKRGAGGSALVQMLCRQDREH
eukprot:485291-Pleurochrysis_carterae.AAC.1